MKNIVSKINLKLFSIGLISILAIVSCDNFESTLLSKPSVIFSTDPNQPYPIIANQVGYFKADYSPNPQDLVFDGSNNNPLLTSLKDSVVVFVEGGPKHFVDLEEFNGFKSAILSGAIDGSDGFPNHSFIGMHQMHETNPTVFGSGTSFTQNNAEEVNNQTLDMIENVVEWLKSNDKVVFLFGHSNGSFMLQNYMASGRTNPSYYILTGTRLMPIQDMLNNYPNYVDINYTDGIILNTVNISDIAKPYFNVLRYLQMNHNKNYLGLLNGNPMLSKTFYSLGFKDEALGRISNEEENFINANCPHAYFTEGDHATASGGVAYALQLFRQ